MRDAGADLARRAWVRCPRCPSAARGAAAAECSDCRRGRACHDHWSFLLAAEPRHLFVQCPQCWHRWWHDTEFGAADRPADLDLPPAWPDAA